MIPLAQFKEYMICLISFSKFSDALPAFTRGRAIGYIWIICLGVNIGRLEWSKKPVPSISIGTFLLLKASKTISLPPQGLW